MTRQQRRAEERAQAKKAQTGFIILVVTNVAEDLPNMHPPTNFMTRLADRVYRYYHVSERTQGTNFKDVDGQVILQLRVFKTLSEAQTWASEDARQRDLLLAHGKDRTTVHVQ